MCFGVYFDQILSIFKYIQFMIVTAHLLCGGGGGRGGGDIYIIIIQLQALLGLGACSPKKIWKK